MKVIVHGNDAISPHLIDSVSASDAAGRIEVLVKHRTEKSEKEKVSVLSDPRKKLTLESGKTIANEITAIIEDYKDAVSKLGEGEDIPENLEISHTAETILNLSAWSHGHLSVKFEKDSDTIALALAELLWRWPHSFKPTDKQLVLRVNTEESEISEIASKDAYKSRVKELMIKERDAEAFAAWARPYMSQLNRFGDRMRISEEEAKELFEGAAQHHSVDISKQKKAVKSDDGESIDYDVVWGEYSEPDTTKFAVFGRTTVIAPTLNRAKTLATQELKSWLNSEIEEKDDKKRETLIKCQKAMENSVSLHKGKWQEGRGRAKRFFGNHMNVWCGMFLGVSVSKAGK